MQITQSQAKVYKLSSKDEYRAALNHIWLEGDAVTASDSYKLLSVRGDEKNTYEPTLVQRSEVERAIKLSKIDKSPVVEVTPPEEAPADIPRWKHLVKHQKLGVVNKAYLNRQYLIELLQAIDSDMIELGVGSNRLAPVIFTAENFEQETKHRYFGLLMPVRK